MGGDGTHSPVLPSFTHTPSAWPWSRARTGNTRVLVSSPQPCSELRPGLVAPAHCGAKHRGPRAARVFYTALWFPALAGRRQRPPAQERAPSRSSVL